MNTEKKQKVWDMIYPKIKHLEDYCTINLRGIEDDTIYFHPQFIIDETFEITSQCDTGNRYIYALRANIKQEDGTTFSMDIYDDLLTPVITGYKTNKTIVIEALNTLIKVKNHIAELNNYSNDYIHNLLMSNSIDAISNAFINEIKATNKLISYMQTIKK
jgi:hypothetical protein